LAASSCSNKKKRKKSKGGRTMDLTVFNNLLDFANAAMPLGWSIEAI